LSRGYAPLPAAGAVRDLLSIVQYPNTIATGETNRLEEQYFAHRQPDAWRNEADGDGDDRRWYRGETDWAREWQGALEAECSRNGNGQGMSWEAVATFALSFVTLVGLNLGAIRWLLTRNEAELGKRLNDMKREGSEFSHELERELLQLKAQLPVEYVRREDWIRFSNTLEAKIDAMRAEVRAEIADLRTRIYQRGSRTTATPEGAA
jgi:hypothetical protein